MAEKEDDIVARAHRRFKECEEWEGTSRQRFKDDIEFLFADSDDQRQWDAAVRARRQINGQPMVTINKTHTHWLHVVNEAKENCPAISVKPTGDKATYESAQVFAAVIRHIEAQSKAQTAYKIASEFQVGGGIGYWRIVTEYSDDNSFDQDIRIKQIPDPLSVYLDPHIKERDGSDARFGFIYEDMPREKFEGKYPKAAVIPSSDTGVQSWVLKDVVRVANYYEVETRKEWLYAITGEDGEIRFVRESALEANERALLSEAAKAEGDIVTRRRVDKRTVKSYVIAGNKIVSKGVWAGKYIPIIRLPGEEVIVEGRLDRKGLTRYLKDSQRAYNYNAAAALEYGALQSKSPYIAPVEAIEGVENYWATANTQSHAYLPFNHADENGNPIPAPARQPPPIGAPVYLEGMQAAEHQLMMASGQYESTFSSQGNEISGVSIDKRQKQGERVTFHFLDALSDAIRFTGIQLLDLIPVVYDTKRVLRIVGEDGEEQTIQVDPQAGPAVQMMENSKDNKVAAIFNPGVGTYAVTASVGPNYESRRQEAFEAMTNLLVNRPELANVVGDLYMGTADFPIADKLQERMRNWINATNPGVTGNGPTPQEMQLQQQIQQMGEMMQQMEQALMEKESALQIEKSRINMDAMNHLALRMENERNDLINAFKAETDRLKAVFGALDPEVLAAITDKMAGEILTAPNPAEDVNPPSLDPAAAFAFGLPAVMDAQAQ